MKLKVTKGSQLAYGDKVLKEGDTFEPDKNDDHMVEVWVNSGAVEEVKPAKKTKAKEAKSDD